MSKEEALKQLVRLVSDFRQGANSYPSVACRWIKSPDSQPSAGRAPNPPNVTPRRKYNNVDFRLQDHDFASIEFRLYGSERGIKRFEALASIAGDEVSRMLGRHFWRPVEEHRAYAISAWVEMIVGWLVRDTSVTSANHHRYVWNYKGDVISYDQWGLTRSKPESYPDYDFSEDAPNPAWYIHVPDLFESSARFIRYVRNHFPDRVYWARSKNADLKHVESASIILDALHPPLIDLQNYIIRSEEVGADEGQLSKLRSAVQAKIKYVLELDSCRLGDIAQRYEWPNSEDWGTPFHDLLKRFDSLAPEDVNAFEQAIVDKLDSLNRLGRHLTQPRKPAESESTDRKQKRKLNAPGRPAGPKDSDEEKLWAQQKEWADQWVAFQAAMRQRGARATIREFVAHIGQLDREDQIRDGLKAHSKRQDRESTRETERCR